MAWCESRGVDFLFGLAKNRRPIGRIRDAMPEADNRYRQSGKASPVFEDFDYCARKSWSRSRRVVAKAEI